jgi:putative acetyltransferase
MIIRPSTAADCEALFDCWLRSVQATHTFVSPQDIEEMKPQVRAYLSSDAELWVACDDSGATLGFMGLSEGNIDSMFLAPQFMGRGMTGRSELDEQGRPYPVLHMKLIAPTLVRPPERRPQ